MMYNTALAPAIMVASRKGGTAKTTTSFHMAWRAAERGLRVLVVDTDAQGDAYVRLRGQDARNRPPWEWTPGSWVMHSPGRYVVPGSNEYDLVVIDTAPVNDLPEGPPPAAVVVVVNGEDACRDSLVTVAAAVKRGAVQILGLLAGTGETAGKDKALVRYRMRPPRGVTVAAPAVRYGEAVADHETARRPAWHLDPLDPAADSVRDACDWLLDAVGVRVGKGPEDMLDAFQGLARSHDGQVDGIPVVEVARLLDVLRYRRVALGVFRAVALSPTRTRPPWKAP